MPIDADCAFCRIVAGEDGQAREVYRDESVVAFFPDEPATLGHTMVVPAGHYPMVFDLPDEVLTHLAVVTKRLAVAIQQAVHPTGLNLIQSNGSSATQSVPHLHVHVVPRWDEDDLGDIWPPSSPVSEVATDAAWDSIRAACSREMP
ncbi:HIT family protein [Ornithinimicrobium sp. Y1847]|uniref:HIT family protein n=1 Tax=Ornithinimicrobium sp. Y1847 TaxID=3405419 RepID=UPI003B66E3AF